MAAKWIARELAALQCSPPPCVVSVEPDQHDSFKRIIAMKGPDNTVHEGRTIRLLVVFPSKYPFDLKKASLTFKVGDMDQRFHHGGE